LIQRIELVTLWDLVRIKMGGKTDLGIPLFEGLSRAEIHSIIMAVTLKQVEAGEVLFHKGDRSESMYAIISGRFDVIDFDPTCTLDSHEAIQTCVSKIGTGDILGEMGLLRSAPRSASVVATEPGELLPINWKVIQRLQWLYPPAAHKLFINMMRILCDRVEKLTTGLASASLKDDLTGLKNRAGFVRALEQEANRAHRHQETLDMATIDIEFEENAENNLERRKNEAIRVIADILTATVRRCDMVGRIDTQTFAILFPESNRSSIQRIMDRFKKGLRATQYRPESTICFSIAFNACPIHLKAENDGQQLLEKILMQMKTRGNQQGSFTFLSTH
jgi:diguanylate cyclase (GGDEF)-like protein